mgnify:CR=1 FL=1
MAQKKAIPFLQDMRLSFALRAEDAFDLVSDDVMDELTAVGEYWRGSKCSGCCAMC